VTLLIAGRIARGGRLEEGWIEVDGAVVRATGAGKSARREPDGAKRAQHLRRAMEAQPVQLLAATEPAPAAVAEG
jgi:hypothetical protein